MEEYKAASLKGLSAAIEEMEERVANQSGDFTHPVNQDKQKTEDIMSKVEERPQDVSNQNGSAPLPLEDGQDLAIADDDVMSHLEDLEAEIMAALADEDFELDDELEREQALSTTPTSASPINKGVTFQQQERRDQTPPPPLVKPKVRFTPSYHSYVTSEERGWAEPEFKRDVEVIRRVYPESKSSSNVSQTVKRKSATYVYVHVLCMCSTIF